MFYALALSADWQPSKPGQAPRYCIRHAGPGEFPHSQRFLVDLAFDRLRTVVDARVRAEVFAVLDVFGRPTRSGSLLAPVSRFHSSKVLPEIFPSTSSCANLRRCAGLLNGIARCYRRGPPSSREAVTDGTKEMHAV